MYAPGDPYNLVDILQKADAGDVRAMVDAVLIMIAEGFVGRDADPDINERYITYLRKLIEAEWSPAYIILGGEYEHGNSVRQDAQEALRLYEKGIEHGHSYGYECIGNMYFKGIVVEKDYKKAFSYFKKVKRSQQNFLLKYALGEMYRLGLYVRKNEKKANQYYSEIVYANGKHDEIDQYFWKSCFRLAKAKHYGNGMEIDLQESLRLLNKIKDDFDPVNKAHKGWDEEISRDEFLSEWVSVNHELGNF